MLGRAVSVADVCAGSGRSSQRDCRLLSGPRRHQHRPGRAIRSDSDPHVVIDAPGGERVPGAAAADRGLPDREQPDHLAGGGDTGAHDVHAHEARLPPTTPKGGGWQPSCISYTLAQPPAPTEQYVSRAGTSPPTIQAGQTVQPGQQIAEFIPGGGKETGCAAASGSPVSTRAAQLNQEAQTGDAGANSGTYCGQAMRPHPTGRRTPRALPKAGQSSAVNAEREASLDEIWRISELSTRRVTSHWRAAFRPSRTSWLR
jgi:hypothetical protein